jgi:hypothetical protein
MMRGNDRDAIWALVQSHGSYMALSEESKEIWWSISLQFTNVPVWKGFSGTGSTILPHRLESAGFAMIGLPGALG